MILFMTYFEVLLLVLVSVWSVSTQHVHYVLPNGSSPLNCPAQPCLTLNQYTQHTGTYFTTGATFHFLAGNHSLQATVTLTNISDVTFRGEGNDSQATITGRSDGTTIQLYSNSNFNIENLTFILYSHRITPKYSILEIFSSNSIKIAYCTFQSLSPHSVISLQGSSVEVVNCVFSNIKSTTFSGDGAIFAKNANFTLSESNFIGSSGQAIKVESTNLTVSGSKFIRNTAPSLICGIVCARNTNFTLSGSKFIGNHGRAIKAESTNLIVNGSIFVGNTGLYGGVIYGKNAIFTLSGSVFLESRGGAIKIIKSSLNLKEALGNVFAHNSARKGGAIYCEDCTINMVRNCTPPKKVEYYSFSGSNLSACFTYFYNNTAASSGNGGALFINGKRSFVLLNGTNTVFADNKARLGGAIYSKSKIQLSGLNILFEGNMAGNGGAIYIVSANVILDRLKFTNNKAIHYGGALCVDNANVIFGGTNLISSFGKFGGGKYANNSITTMEGHILANNSAMISGGGIYSVSGTLLLNGDMLFFHSTAGRDGGALYATRTNITLNNRVKFTSNSAQNGGAMFISATTSLTLSHHASLTTFYNHASLYGGAIYHDDKPTPQLCSNPRKGISRNSPDCFMRLENYEEAFITSYHDTANRDGSFLYGGLLDKCRLSMDGTYNYSIMPYNFLITSIFNITSNRNKANQIASLPYRLMFCDDPPYYYDKSVSVSRGQTFTVSIQAIGLKPVQVTALPGISARVHLNQVIQTVSSSKCAKITFNFYSSQDTDELRLATRSSCGNTGTVEAVIEVTLLPCPYPFVHDGEECVCDKRLLEYSNVNCTTDEHNNSHVTKRHGTDFWMSVSYYDTNGSYEGLILYKTCPPQYCKTQTVDVSLDDLDSQCDDNRGGVLCGQCLANYSLMLGSSKCRHCSHKHLALLLTFTAAGIALVVILSFLRLTVATGMMNSVILYTNIIQANKNLIFLVNERNVLTIFVAWMNLDLGFETCFYNGMTAYVQTWLQFAFPLYVWILISFIILSSRYSITVSKLIGHNPIAVLATLLLMSYTKLLKIIIEVYSSADLAYPDNQTVTVWLKDANVPYLQSWHLLLTVVTTLVLVLFFLPYTLLLLLGYKLYRFSGRKYLHWLHRVRPLLESYYAPYNIHTRYWTGFLLLVRCALYIIFSFYSLENTNKSLLAINLMFTGLFFLLLLMSLCYFHLLYIKVHNNIMEISTYLNLIVLSAATNIGANPPALVYSLVGLIFVTMLSIIIYHFHLLYIAKSQVWRQFKVKLCTLKEKLIHSATRTAAEPPLDGGKSSHDPHKIVTHSEIELREPLL